MKVITLTIFIIFCAGTNYAQSDTALPVRRFEVTQFINTVRNSEISNENVFVVSTPSAMSAENICHIVANEKDLFSAKDSNFMVTQVKMYQTLLLDTTFVENVTFLGREEIAHLIKRTKNGSDWELFYKKYGRRFYWLSFPIFTADRRYCIIEIGYACGDLCGESKTMIFEKNATSWSRIKVLDQVVF